MASESHATILVVDDNPAGRYATSRILRAAGFSVLEAATGKDGLALAPGADLVVLDVNLPDISGFEVCRMLRSNHQTMRIPVVHLSATFIKDTDKVEGLEAGADGYLTHPVEPPVLIATVNAFLRARRAEDEMRRSEAKFKAIFDQALSGILLVSADLVYLEANPAVCGFLGRTREEIIGHHSSSFIPAGHEQDFVAIARQIEVQGAWRGTFQMIRADGKQVDLEWSIVRHSVPGVRLAVVTDVTERKAHEAERERLLAAERAAREEAERANRVKDDFLATLSHELRTPLNAILGWSQILSTGESTPDEVREGADAIERNAQSQAQLISDLLDVSRITSGTFRLDRRSIDPAAVIDLALDTIAPAVQAKGIRLERVLDPAAGPIFGDPDRLQQVLWNLVSNSIKFTPSGGMIRVSVERENAHVVITIKDNGQGIKPDFLPYIFDRFRQEDSTTKRNQGGLGLGLAIVKHLVELHGGTICAESAGAGQGSTFSARLPVPVLEIDRSSSGDDEASTPATARADTESQPAGADSAHGPVMLQGISVLLVENDADARTVLRRVLTKAGAMVRDAETVHAALALVAEATPDVLISDLGMPEQDGYDLIKSLRRGNKGEFIPAIALTAFAGREDREHSLAAGFQLHLAKPVRLEKLLQGVASLAQLKHATPPTS